MSNFLDDLDKTLAWLDGRNVDDISSTYQSLKDFCKQVNSGLMHYQEKFDSYFFEMKIFKKGTLHLDFKDKKLLDRFNVMAAEGKKWIGGGY